MAAQQRSRGGSAGRRNLLVVFAFVSMLAVLAIFNLMQGPSSSGGGGDDDDGGRGRRRPSAGLQAEVKGGGEQARGDKSHGDEGHTDEEQQATLPPLTTPVEGPGWFTSPDYDVQQFPPNVAVCLANSAPFIGAISVPSALLAEVPRHRPRHIQAVLDEIDKFGFERYVQAGAGGEKASNSADVTQEDVQRARSNWIESLPPAPVTSIGCPRADDAAGGEANEGIPPQPPNMRAPNVFFSKQQPADLEAMGSGMLIYNALRDTIQSAIIDASPMVIDVGCVVGEVFARSHPKATVVCLHPNKKFATKASYHEPPANLYHLFAPMKQTLTKGDFAQFFDVCNFFTLVFVLGNLRRDLSQPSDELVEMLKKVLPSSALVYAAVPNGLADTEFAASQFISAPLVTLSPQEEEALRFQKLEALVKKPKGHKATAPKIEVPPPRIDALTSRDVAMVRVGNDTPRSSLTLIREYRVGRSHRPCRKTWNAPYVQWARSQSVTFDEGKVSFLVKLVQKDGQLQDAKLRFIHPLQYLHSLNLDTLLGAGLSDPVRIRLLGEMIATPRYSDPLPHNWVVADGGKVHRIDKIDVAYDAKVDESQGYWGRSTRGYLHLLTEHLCLPVNADGTPSPFLRMEGDCDVYCKNCVDLCSYLPKGSICDDCAKCGKECIAPIGLTLQSAALLYDPISFAKTSMCQKTYSSMHAARKIWGKWERQDNAGVANAGGVGEGN